MTPGPVLATVGGLLILVGSAFGWQQVPVTAQSTEPNASVTDGAPLDGAALFRAKGCASCHTGPDSKAAFTGPPSLADAPEWAGDRRPGLSAAEYLRESIRDPGVFVSPAFEGGGGGPMTGMPSLAVSDAEVDALVAYLLAR